MNVRPISAPYLGFLFRPSRRGKRQSYTYSKLGKKQEERYEIAITNNICEGKLDREKTADTLLSVAFNRAAELLETTRDLDKVTRFIETMSKLKTPENNTASNFEQLYVSLTKLSQNVKTKYIDVEEVK